MNVPESSLKFLLRFIVISVFASIVACAPAEHTPRVWIDFPKDGTHFNQPGPISVTAHAAATPGIGYIIFSVNNIPYSQHTPSVDGAIFANFLIPWAPAENGFYSLDVSMYDVNGNYCGSAFSRVRVGTSEQDDPTTVPTVITVTPVVTDTPTPPPDLPTATITPTVTLTQQTPISISFYTDKLSITPGECVQLSWTVQNANEVLLNNAQVTSSGSSQACPTTTTEYNLSANKGQEYRYEQIIITVNAPSDTTPPPVPQPQVPSNGLHITCKASQTLVWLPVSDPSGISGYDVELLKNVSGTWQRVKTWNGVTGKQVEAPVDCGLQYRWAVRAVDNSGNKSAWSNWFTYFIDLS